MCIGGVGGEPGQCLGSGEGCVMSRVRVCVGGAHMRLDCAEGSGLGSKPSFCSHYSFKNTLIALDELATDGCPTFCKS